MICKRCKKSFEIIEEFCFHDCLKQARDSSVLSHKDKLYYNSKENKFLLVTRINLRFFLFDDFDDNKPYTSRSSSKMAEYLKDYVLIEEDFSNIYIKG